MAHAAALGLNRGAKAGNRRENESRRPNHIAIIHLKTGKATGLRKGSVKGDEIRMKGSARPHRGGGVALLAAFGRLEVGEIKPRTEVQARLRGKHFVQHAV